MKILPYEAAFGPQVREIFFESSTKKTFLDVTEKEQFYEKYLGFYLKHFSEFAFVGVESKVMGYVVAMPVTLDERLLKLQGHLKIFTEEFQEFPAHLHINCHHESRGKGLGSQLVERVVARLRSAKITGLHIITDPNSRNRAFYRKLGFDFEQERDGLLFMGKNLTGI